MSLDEVKNMKYGCPIFHKTVSPPTCRSCNLKTTCSRMMEFRNAEREFAKYKGTILEGGMKEVVKLKKEAVDYIFGAIIEAAGSGSFRR